MNEYLSLIKGEEQVRGPRQDAPRAIDQVIPSRNRVWISFQHGCSLYQFSTRILHSVERRQSISRACRKMLNTSHAHGTKPSDITSRNNIKQRQMEALACSHNL